MIFGSYPCCDGDLTLSVEGIDTPMIQREVCPHCGALVWHKLSRVDPESWTDAGFREIYNVGDETKAVTLKNPPAPMTPQEQAVMDVIVQRMADAIAEDLFNGDGTNGLRGIL